MLAQMGAANRSVITATLDWAVKPILQFRVARKSREGNTGTSQAQGQGQATRDRILERARALICTKGVQGTMRSTATAGVSGSQAQPRTRTPHRQKAPGLRPARVRLAGQDADGVILLHREDQYEKESPRAD
jgi:hypothetical protein